MVRQDSSGWVSRRGDQSRMGTGSVHTARGCVSGDIKARGEAERFGSSIQGGTSRAEPVMAPPFLRLARLPPRTSVELNTSSGNRSGVEIHRELDRMGPHSDRVDLVPAFIVDPALDQAFTENIVCKKEVIITLER